MPGVGLVLKAQTQWWTKTEPQPTKQMNFPSNRILHQCLFLCPLVVALYVYETI